MADEEIGHGTGRCVWDAAADSSEVCGLLVSQGVRRCRLAAFGPRLGRARRVSLIELFL